MKPCPTCSPTVALPLDAFYKRSNGRPQHECKTCLKARSAVNNRERMRKVRAHKRQSAEYAKAAIAGKIPS